MEEIQITTYEGAAEELARRLVNLYELKVFPRQGKIFADMLCEACAKGGSFLNSLGEIDNKIAKRDIAQDALIEIKRADYLLKIMRVGNYYTESEIRELAEYIKQIIKLLTDLLVVAYEQTMNADVRIIQPILQGKIQPALASPQVSLLSDGAPFGYDNLLNTDDKKAEKQSEGKAEAAAKKPKDKAEERNNIKADDIIIDNRTLKEKRNEKKVDKNSKEFSARMTETTPKDENPSQESGGDNPTEE
ncbi:MAG: hypothetical protein K2N47_00155 [Clostridia bacterium]|nr:hypothetical protein [Clostridia bacterium]